MAALQVYAVEASPMADWAAKLCRENPLAANVVEVIKGKVEVISTDEKADVLVSEPMGTLLVRRVCCTRPAVTRIWLLKQCSARHPSVPR